MDRRCRSRLAVAVAAALGGYAWASPAFAQSTPDVFVKYLDNQDVSTGGSAAIAGASYDPATGYFWTAGFTNATQAIRRIDPSDAANATKLTFNAASNQWTPVTYTPGPNGGGLGAPAAWGVQESDWTRFVRSTSLTDNGGSGTSPVATFTGQSTAGNIVLNPETITVNGITYAPGKLGVFVDAMTVGGTGSTPANSKTVYVYDLGNVGASAAGRRDRNGNGIVDWNDVFDVVATKQDFMTAGNGTSTTVNVARSFTFSRTDGRFIYLNESQANYGGIWRVDLTKTGTDALQRIANVTADTRINTEPTVVTTGARDFDLADAIAGDQIVVATSSANGGAGVTGGLGYFVHNPAANQTSVGRTLVHQGRLQTVVGGGSPTILSTVADAGGNVYFGESGVSDALFRLDPQGRLAKVVGSEQHTSFQVARAAEDGTGTQLLDLQARNVTLSRGASTFSVPEILIGDTAFDAPVGALAFKTGDFDGDNAVTAADTAFFIQQFNRNVAAGLARTDANYQAYLKADLDGSARFVTAVNGVNVAAVTNKDLLTLFQFINKVPGDANLDGVVNSADQAILTANLGQAGNWLKGDFNRDGTVDAADQALLTANLGATYTLDGFDPVATYAGGATGTWAGVQKAGGAVADADSIVTVDRVAGATVAGPAANASVAYLTVGNNVAGGAATTLQLQPGFTLSSTEGVLVRPTGALTGSAGAVLKLGTPGAIGTLAVDDGGTIGGSFRLQGSLFVANAGNQTFAGTVENSGADVASVSKTGEGLLVLDGANTYTGPTSVFGGTLQAAQGTGLPAASVLQIRGGVYQTNGTFARTLGTAAGQFNMSAGGGFAARGGVLTVNPNGGAEGAESLAWTATSFIGANPFVLGSTSADNTIRFADGLNLGTATTPLTVREVRVIDNPASTADRAVLAYPVAGTSAFTLNKTGTGTLALSATNTYAGPTTVSAGTLLVNGSTSTGAISVAAGATIGGGGTVGGPLSITSGGSIAPGDGVGQLKLAGGLALASGSVLAFDLGTAADLLTVSGGAFTGAADAGGVTVNLADAGGLSYNQSYTLINWAGSTPTGVDLTDFVLGTTPIPGTLAIQGNTLVLNIAVPEPGTAGLAAAGAAGGLLARRRRRSA